MFAEVFQEHVDEGLEALDLIWVEAATHTTHWRYIVYWLAALGRLIAGTGDRANAQMRRALVEARDSSMYSRRSSTRSVRRSSPRRPSSVDSDR